MKRIINIAFICTAMLYGCKKLYNPTVSSTNINNLVVEGFINTGTDSTIIILSRAVAVSNKTAVSAETKATVTVENAQGTSYAIPETTIKGTYAARSLNLDNTKQYRLRIKTSGGKTYLSDLVDPVVTPPIDSIGYTVGANGIDLYANTHDPANKIQYYRYTFRETWKFHTQYSAQYIFSAVDTLLHPRAPSQQIYECFATDTSAHTILYSTAALGQSVAYRVPVISVESTSEKLEIRYSILVRQQALSKGAYDFYDALKKNTENLGSIFDAQPSQLVGNVHNTADASEPVIGFIAAGTTQTKRIYLLKTDLPQSFQVPATFGCDISTAFYYPSHNILHPPPPEGRIPPPDYYVEEQLYPNVDGRLDNGPAKGLALQSFGNGFSGGYMFTTRACADCTLRGFTKTPSFWK